MRRAIVLFFCLISIFIISCKGDKEKVDAKSTAGQKPSALSVDGFIVTPKFFQEKIEVPGTIVANESAEIHPEVSGRIVYLNVAEGKFVPKGAVLAKLYDGDLQAQLKKIKIQLALAEKTEQRQAQLLKIQGISQQDYDISLLQVNNLKADIGILQTSISKTVVRAPFSGQLGLKDISQGAYVSPATVIAVINQTQILKLDFTIPEKYIDKIKIGQPVDFTFEGAKQKHIATIIATESNITENTRTLTVRARVTNRTNELLPGSFVKVNINMTPNENALFVPSQAIIPKARGKEIIRYKNGVAFFSDVTTGIRDSSMVQILEGIQPGDTVVVSGLLSVRPEAKIQIRNIVKQDTLSQ